MHDSNDGMVAFSLYCGKFKAVSVNAMKSLNF